MTELIKAAILGLVEGLTEFIPVSSTGHLILTGDLLKFQGALAETFDVVIQIGAILAVMVAFPRRFIRLFDFRRAPTEFAGLRGIMLLALTTLPAVIVGLLGHDFIKAHLYHSLPVAMGLLAGSVWILWVEHSSRSSRCEEVDGLTWRDALWIGVFQCLAMWPGVSRSAATILGAMMLGVGRRAATEYSFLAAVPVLFLAAAYDLLKSFGRLDSHSLPVLGMGLAVAFVSGLITVKFLIRFLSRHTLVSFAWYRIGLGTVVLWLLFRSQI